MESITPIMALLLFGMFIINFATGEYNASVTFLVGAVILMAIVEETNA